MAVMTELNHAPHPSGNLVEAHYYVAGPGLGFSTLSVVLLLVHRHRDKRLRWDDVFVSSSWAFSVTMQILMLYARQLKTLCYHRDDIPPENFKVYSEPFQLIYVAAPMFVLSTGCAEMSILLSYWRIAFVEKVCSFTLYTLMTAVSPMTLIMTVLLFIARPGTSSLDTIALSIVMASFSIGIDVLLAVLAILKVFMLRTSLKNKLRATALFSLGLVHSRTAIASIVRLVLLKQLQGSSDLTWDSASANITSFFGVNLHVIFACLPAVRIVITSYAVLLLSKRT
ncbi:hypothetical protein LX32DRAFT_658881 [Colletotrichum zoysiae]|uniref:Rhodopsin domain-containing protein n=1 Tax=Colletotrichum zoysiae TaxID=1216348 RepID=A0AAD9H1N3_9PEZI|nr:hypothetical protein LX32DRAFT_658881 [Colletotrichum zoysiae]